MFWKTPQKRIYLDHAAATPVRPEVVQAMLPYLTEAYGNPSAIHTEGAQGRQAVENARTTIARLTRTRPEDLVFTSCGTESNNLTIYGYLRFLTETHGRAFTDCEIVSTRLEHPSVLEVLGHVESHGVVVKFVDVDADGKILLPSLQAALSPKTVLVTFAYANSEVGVVQDVHRLARVVKKYARETEQEIVVHLDASQAPLWLSCELDRLGVDLMTLDVGKCCGPKGVGMLVRRHGVELMPIMLGGGQEGGLRAGTENVAAIVGAATAFEIAQAGWVARSEQVQQLRDTFIEQLCALPGVVLNGSKENRLANNVNISLPGFDTEYAVVMLDKAGIAASTKSACSGAGSGQSGVVYELTKDAARAAATIRFSLGEETTEKDIEKVVETLRGFIEKMSDWKNQ